MKNKDKFKKYLIALLVPISAFLVCELVTFIFTKKHLFSSSFDYYNFLARMPIKIIAAYALQINMCSGRMDLSLGGQRLIGAIIGGNIALSLGFGAFGIVFMILLFGALAGFISGAIFTTLRVDAFVLGLGMAMIFEGISMSYEVKGFSMYQNEIVNILSNKNLIFIVGIVVIVFMYILMNKTVFGYKYNAIRGSQTAAVNAGINERIICLMCYTLAGILISLSGVFSAAVDGIIPSTINLGSISTVFNGFLQIMLGIYLSSYVPVEIGVVFGAITVKLIEILLGKFNVPINYTNIILMLVMFAILIVLNLIKDKSVDLMYKKRSTVD